MPIWQKMLRDASPPLLKSILQCCHTHAVAPATTLSPASTRPTSPNTGYHASSHVMLVMRQRLNEMQNTQSSEECQAADEDLTGDTEIANILVNMITRTSSGSPQPSATQLCTCLTRMKLDRICTGTKNEHPRKILVKYAPADRRVLQTLLTTSSVTPQTRGRPKPTSLTPDLRVMRPVRKPKKVQTAVTFYGCGQ
ncbi:hypothetical protein GWK47_051349 [Chionoecetes opilio]|uniref:Uncharacterized protein n=1 Tax=Chionoecetes opilio TaxID=41210 RepID=A0A8J4Y253_CHIOP|nr:hypothetical protein GWK47_051349 [Chionoecetes opilio]